VVRIAGAYLALARLSPGQPAAGIARDVLLAALILSGSVVVARIAGGLVVAYTSRVENLPSSSLFGTTTRVVMVLGVLVLLRSLGIAVSPIVAGLGLGGLAVSLALQDPLSNILAGYQVIVSRQLAPGDFVSLGAEQQGYV
jgi:small-conductance mechanosensitive channel